MNSILLLKYPAKSGEFTARVFIFSMIGKAAIAKNVILSE
jgi:hypothetical protein